MILDGDVVTHAPFGALPAGTTPVTIGVDTAPFVVGRQGTNVVRLRSGATDAIVEGAPIPLPGTAPKGSGFGTALGGTIVYVWAEHRSPTIVDDTTAFFVAAVASGEKAFSAGTSLGDYDDDFSSLTVQRVRGAAQAGYCAIQTGTFDNPKKNCGAMVTVDGRSPLSGYGVGATNVPAFAKSETGVGIASCEGNTLDVGTDTTKEVALYPCLDPQALVFDDAGAPHLLTATGGRLYAASRR